MLAGYETFSGEVGTDSESEEEPSSEQEAPEAIPIKQGANGMPSKVRVFIMIRKETVMAQHVCCKQAAVCSPK